MTLALCIHRLWAKSYSSLKRYSLLSQRWMNLFHKQRRFILISVWNQQIIITYEMRRTVNDKYFSFQMVWKRISYLNSNTNNSSLCIVRQRRMSRCTFTRSIFLHQFTLIHRCQVPSFNAFYKTLLQHNFGIRWHRILQVATQH